jgi:hypothetical protein
MKKKEAEFCTRLGHWYDNEGYKILMPGFYPIEAKVIYGKLFNYKSGLKCHQIQSLQMWKNKPSHWKISDLDACSTKHYDMHFAHPAVSHSLFAFHWVKRANKTFYLIDPDTIQGRTDDGEKSLAEDEAEEICFYKGELK